MRKIGELTDETSTRNLVAFLIIEKIKTVADRTSDSSDDSNGEHWVIWIKEEDDVERAKALFAEFQKDPNHPRYSEAVEKASQLAQEEIERNQKKKQNVVVMRGQWTRPQTYRKPLVVTLITISVIVFVLSGGWNYGWSESGQQPERSFVMNALLFVNPDEVDAAVRQYVKQRLPDVDSTDDSSVRDLVKEANNDWDIKLISVRQWQVWRLFTTMFIHFGVIHILFNMMYLNWLGGQFEHHYGTTMLGLFVLAAAALSSTVQILMPMEWQGTPAQTLCGGMSGVVYALAGFIWMKTIYEPQKGLFLSPVTMFVLIIWMLMGIFDGGRMMSMANWAHGVGFAFGLAVGYFPQLFKARS